MSTITEAGLRESVHRCYTMYPNHRRVATKMKLPLHVVMYILGLMPQWLFDRVNQ